MRNDQGDELDPWSGDPNQTPPNTTGSLTNDNRGTGVDDRASRQKQADELNQKLGLKDTGNLESFLSGRASWDEYMKDETARSTNYTGDRLTDSQGPNSWYDTHGKYIGPPQGAGSGGASAQKYSGLMSQMQGTSDPAQQAVARDKLARQVFADLEAAGHDVSWKNDELIVDGRRYTVGGIADATKYTPGEIGTSDIPNLSVDDWFSRATASTPVEHMADQVVMDVLNDPFGGFDQGYTDKLKAQAKDTSADTYLQEQAGIDEAAHALNQDATMSPWAQSEKMATRRAHDLGLAGMNTDIDVKVQDLRSAKQREAAGLGASYAGQKASQRQAALTLSSDNVFRQAALTGDRMALRESVKQAAASLGVQTDALMRDYIIAKQRELTTRTGMALGYDIDTQKLDQSDRQFKEELTFRLAQLEQQAKQFDANYDLDLADLQFRQDNEAWRRANPA